MKADEIGDLDYEIVQILLNDFNLKEIVDTNFLGLLQKELDNAKIVTIGIAVGEGEEGRIIALGHLKPDYEKDNKLIIDTRDPEDLKKIINVIKKLKDD